MVLHFECIRNILLEMRYLALHFSKISKTQQFFSRGIVQRERGCRCSIPFREGIMSLSPEPDLTVLRCNLAHLLEIISKVGDRVS